MGACGEGPKVTPRRAFVPSGRDHTNPAVTQDAPWPSLEARQLAVRALGVTAREGSDGGRDDRGRRQPVS